jgi:hypothetical protein
MTDLNVLRLRMQETHDLSGTYVSSDVDDVSQSLDFEHFWISERGQLAHDLSHNNEKVSALLQSVDGNFDKLSSVQLEALIAIGNTITSLELGLPDSPAFLQESDCAKIVECFPRLSKLSIVKCQTLTTECLKTFSELPALTFLNLRGCSITDDGLMHLKELEILRLFQCDTITDDTLKVIATFKNLQKLEISGFKNTRVTDTGIGYLRLLNLIDLNISRNPNLTDKAVEYVSQIDSLITLDISFCDEVTDACVQHLSQLKNLHILAAEDCNFTADTLKHIFKTYFVPF